MIVDIYSENIDETGVASRCNKEKKEEFVSNVVNRSSSPPQYRRSFQYRSERKPRTYRSRRFRRNSTPLPSIAFISLYSYIAYPPIPHGLS